MPQVAHNPELQSIQAMIDEDSNPESRALYSKDHANSMLAKAKKIPNKKGRVQEFHKVAPQLQTPTLQ